MLSLRPATALDAPLLRRWESAAHLARALGDDDWQWESTLVDGASWRSRLIAEIKGRAIGFLEIIDPSGDEEKYWGDLPPGYRAVDLWIGEPDALGQGHGTAMMRLASDKCFADPSVHTVLVDPLVSNARAHRFYERLGCVFAERRQFGEDDTFVYQLSRQEYSKNPRPLS